MRIQNNNGFTVFEVLVAMAISITLFGLVLSIYTLSVRSLASGQNRAELTQTSRSTMERITRDVRETRDIASNLPENADNPEEPPLSELMLEDGHSENLQYIYYYLNGTDLQRQVRIYYFNEEPEVPVPHNAEDEFGNPPQMDIISDNKVGQYVSTILFYGHNPVAVELTLQKSSNMHQTRTLLYGRNL
ncbi:MAG: hypothetical protein U1C18_01230 [Patescibacteria group bacterium]|nr:hypothetical protein [Patescibacteria group bacterium]